MFERLWLILAAKAGCVRILVEPGGVGGQRALRRSHLLDSPPHKLSQAYGVGRGGGGRVLVIRGGGCIGGQVWEDHVSGTTLEGLVGFLHEIKGGECSFQVGRGDVKPGGTV